LKRPHLTSRGIRRFVNNFTIHEVDHFVINM
jgi:hypothetical protein